MSTFLPAHEPPLWWERCLSQPIVVIAAWSVAVAIQVLVDPWMPNYAPSISLGELPTWTAVWLSAGIGTGGTTALIGILNSWDNRSRAWAVERAGWILQSVGWVGYAVVVIDEFPASTIAWGSSLALALMGVLRVIALHLMEKQTRRKLAEVDEAITGPQEVQPTDE